MFIDLRNKEANMKKITSCSNDVASKMLDFALVGSEVDHSMFTFVGLDLAHSNTYSHANLKMDS